MCSEALHYIIFETAIIPTKPTTWEEKRKILQSRDEIKKKVEESFILQFATTILVRESKLQSFSDFMKLRNL